MTADTSSGTAAAGDYSVSVQQLAQGQTVTSSVAAGAALSAGTLTIQLGTYVADGAHAADDQFANGRLGRDQHHDRRRRHLARRRSATRSTRANAGVSASIITDANGSRLSLRSTDHRRGQRLQDHGHRDHRRRRPDDGPVGAELRRQHRRRSSQLTLNQYALNAKATVNGIAIESATNKLSNISDGLSLTLLKKSDTPVDVNVAVRHGLDAEGDHRLRVGATPSLQSYISLQTKYDVEHRGGRRHGAQGRPAAGRPVDRRLPEPAARHRQHHVDDLVDVRAAVRPRHRGAEGRHAVGGQRHQADRRRWRIPTSCRSCSRPTARTNENTGIAVRFATLADNADRASTARCSRAPTACKGELSRNQKQQDDMQTHLDATQARLTAQYQALDTTMSQDERAVELRLAAGDADGEGVSRGRRCCEVPAPSARLAAT